MSRQQVSLTVNGQPVAATVDSDLTLLRFLRENGALRGLCMVIGE